MSSGQGEHLGSPELKRSLLLSTAMSFSSNSTSRSAILRDPRATCPANKRKLSPVSHDGTMTSSAWDHRERGGSTARKTTFATERSGEGNRRVLTAGAPWGDRSRVSDRPIKPALRRRAGGRVHGCLSSERGPSGVEVKRIGISDHWLCQLSGQLENFPRVLAHFQFFWTTDQFAALSLYRKLFLYLGEQY